MQLQLNRINIRTQVVTFGVPMNERDIALSRTLNFMHDLLIVSEFAVNRRPNIL